MQRTFGRQWWKLSILWAKRAELLMRDHTLLRLVQENQRLFAVSGYPVKRHKIKPKRLPPRPAMHSYSFTHHTELTALEKRGTTLLRCTRALPLSFAKFLKLALTANVLYRDSCPCDGPRPLLNSATLDKHSVYGFNKAWGFIEDCFMRLSIYNESRTLRNLPPSSSIFREWLS